MGLRGCKPKLKGCMLKFCPKKPNPIAQHIAGFSVIMPGMSIMSCSLEALGLGKDDPMVMDLEAYGVRAWKQTIESADKC